MIKQVHEAINKSADGDFSHWPKLLPIVEFNLRTAPHADTSITPAMALYGRELKKGILELPETTETSLDERDHRKKRKAVQKAMKAISEMIHHVLRPRWHLKGKTFKKGDAVRMHRDPPKDLKYINKWRNLYEDKGDIVGVEDNFHLMSDPTKQAR